MKHLPTACFLLTALALPAFAQTPKALPVDGAAFGGSLSGIDSDWRITIGSGESQRVIPAGDLVFWGRCAEIDRGPLLVLADGGLLAAEVLEADKEKLVADSDLFGLVTVPLELLAAVVFDLPADRRARDLLLNRVSDPGGDSDTVILHNGDEIAGRLEAIGEENIRLEAIVGPLDIEIHRITALVFDPSLMRPVQRQGLHAIVGFDDGSRLIADNLVVDEDSLRIEVAGGLQWKGIAENLVWIQPLGGKATYLSDLKPADYRHLPFLNLSWPHKADRNATGGMLRSGGRLYLKGLGMHSTARLTYLLDGAYQRFQAQAAIDDSTAGCGSVRFRVFVDGSPKYASTTVRGGDPPVPVSVDLTGAKRLDLVVDYADRADELDHANWLDARVVR